MEIGYVTHGYIQGKSALSIIVWLMGCIIFVISIILLTAELKCKNTFYKISALGMTISAIILLISLLFQYGLFLHSPAGYTIPFGIPLILLIALVIIYKESLFLKIFIERIFS